MNLVRDLGVLSVLVLCVACTASAAGKSPGVVGAYMHFRSGTAGTPEQIRALVNEAADAGVQFLLPIAKSTGGAAFYDSKILPHAHADFDPLKVLVDAADERGLKVYPWLCANAEGGANPSPFLEAHPDWCMVNSEGKRVGALDPSSAEARSHIASIVREIAENYDIDGISLDYVRYSSPGRFCYCDRCKAAFKEATGLDCTGADQAAPGTNLWRKWRLWRQRQLTAEMQEIRRALDEAKPGASLGSYVWGAQTYGSRYEVCQDWKTWIKDGLLDWINPSGYVYERRKFKSRAAANLKAVPPGFPAFITIGVTTSHGRLNTSAEVETQVRDSMKLGASGVVFFTLESTRPFLNELSPLLHEIGGKV